MIEIKVQNSWEVEKPIIEDRFDAIGKLRELNFWVNVLDKDFSKLMNENKFPFEIREDGKEPVRFIYDPVNGVATGDDDRVVIINQFLKLFKAFNRTICDNRIKERKEFLGIRQYNPAYPLGGYESGGCSFSDSTNEKTKELTTHELIEMKRKIEIEIRKRMRAEREKRIRR